jgi:peptide deformylase
MNIITAPHPTLRKKAKRIESVDKKLLQNIDLLIDNLLQEKDPEGVGLAFPQINKSLRAFAFRPNPKKKKETIKVLINPEITQCSSDKVLGEDPNNPELEGCLSVPNLYAPVPRWSWIELRYQLIKDGELETYETKYANYHARVIQHEMDHLDGILFTDHVLAYDMPLYIEDGKRMVELEDKSLVKAY